MTFTRASISAFLFLLLRLSHAFYIPGWSIRSYSDGEQIQLLVNKVYSDTTTLQYAFSELPFVCPPSGRKSAGNGLISGSSIGLNLGEVLRGDRIMVSDYELEMRNDQEIRYLCSQKVDKAGLEKAIEVVKDGYVAEWIVDNLPGATSFVTVDKSRKYYAAGFKMGYEEAGRYFLNNHHTFVIRYRRAPGKDGQHGKKVIVGFEVFTKSIEAENRNASGLPADLHEVGRGMELTFATNTTNATSESNPAIPDDANLTIPYTYSVYWREDERLEWSHRWDLYFVNQEESTRTHWLAIVNSLVISGLLTSIVAVILARTIRGDIKGLGANGLEEGRIRLKKSARDNHGGAGLLDQKPGELGDDELSDDESPEDITGWKLLHGDVFRPPPHGLILAPVIGAGMQLVCMSAGLLVLSCLGILNPSYRGGFISMGIVLFVLAGSFSGYFSARVFKTFDGSNWKHNAIVTATFVPGLLFITIFILNLFVWAQASSTAIPLGTLIGLVALWLLIQLPLVYVGSWYGFNQAGSYSHPIPTTTVPRQIPQQSQRLRSVQAILLGGLIPFAVIFIELLFVFRSLWQDKSSQYYAPGFLVVVSSIVIVTIMETTIIAVYVQLCSENYHWWWQSFFVGGSSSIWIFTYCVWYYVKHLHIEGFASSLLFFAYSALACIVYGLLTGTIGFLTAYAFVRRIYGAIKVD